MNFEVAFAIMCLVCILIIILKLTYSRYVELLRDYNCIQKRLITLKNNANKEHTTRLNEKTELLNHLILATNAVISNTEIEKRCNSIIDKYSK